MWACLIGDVGDGHVILMSNMDFYHIVLLVFAMVLGVSIGSFVNVLIFRLRSGTKINGRSKCLSCEEAIEKDTLRVAVEREVDTGAFVTKGPGYLHPHCALEFTGDDELLAHIKANSAALSEGDFSELEAGLSAGAA